MVAVPVSHTDRGIKFIMVNTRAHVAHAFSAVWEVLMYKSTRKPTAFRLWVLLNEVRGSSPVPRKARSAAFI